MRPSENNYFFGRVKLGKWRYLFVYLFIYLFICLFACLSTHLFIYWLIYLFVFSYLFIYLFIYLLLFCFGLFSWDFVKYFDMLFLFILGQWCISNDETSNHQCDCFILTYIHLDWNKSHRPIWVDWSNCQIRRREKWKSIKS